jgi:4-amino-4-deoxy-L-arabinose transferase-like glycosyltransferase
LFAGLSFREILGLFGIVTASLVLRTLILGLRPFQSDESTYIYAAYAMTRGLVPYREIFLAHPPLMYFAYSTFIRLVGVDILRIRLLNVAVYLTTIPMTFLMAKSVLRHHEGRYKIAFLCTAVYAFYPSFFLIISTTALLENLLTLFTLGSFVAYVSYCQTHRRILLFLTGGLLALSILTTFRAVLFVVSIVLFDLVQNIWHKDYRKSFLNMGTIALAMLAPALVLSVVLFYWQAFPQFSFQTVYFQLILPPQDANARLTSIAWYIESMLPLLVTGALGSLYLTKQATDRKTYSLILPLFVFCFVAATLLVAFRSASMHYFYFMTPYLAFLSAMCFFEVASTLFNHSRKKRRTGLDFTLLTVFLALILLLSSQTINYAYETTLPYFHQTPFNQLDSYIGKYIANVTSPDDKIWTSEQSVGFFAERIIVAPYNSSLPFRGFFSSIIGFSHNLDITGEMKDYKEGFVSTKQLVQAWEAKRVKVVVVIHGQGWIPYPDEFLWNGFRNQTGVAEYVRDNYELRLVVTAPEVSYVYHVWVRK